MTQPNSAPALATTSSAAPIPPLAGRRELITACRTLLLWTVLLGGLYPALVTGLAQWVFATAANGSLLTRGDQVIGSALIGQPFTGDRYFWSRPSANGHDAAASAGSNLGPSNPVLHQQLAVRIATFRSAHPQAPPGLPADLVTTSASGLDPHLSPAAARLQAERVARRRGLDPAAVRALVDAHVEPRTFGLLGEPRVNILRLNLALDELAAGMFAPTPIDPVAADPVPGSPPLAPATAEGATTTPPPLPADSTAAIEPGPA